MRTLVQYEHKMFEVVTLHSGMQYIHMAIRSTSSSLIGLKLEFCDHLWETYSSATSRFLHFRKMQQNPEQCYILKLCVKLGKTPKDSKLQHSLMSMPMFHHWYNAFRDGRESAEDELWERQPSAACNEVLQNTANVIIQKDRRISVCELAQCLNISVGGAFAILHDDL